jgi:DNA-3-methyladenine glycosylase II
MIAEYIKTHLKDKDAKLSDLIDNILLPPLNQTDVYLSLIDSIVSQQLSVKAASTIFERFLTLFPNRYPAPEWVLALEHEQLRGVGLSSQKAKYIQNTAQFFLDNELIEKDWHKHSDEEIIAQLTSIKGVGKWTVQMILMFTLQREDILPVDDLGIQQGMTRLYNLDSASKGLKKEMENIAESWRPYRSIASRYIWRWKDLEKFSIA